MSYTVTGNLLLSRIQGSLLKTINTHCDVGGGSSIQFGAHVGGGHPSNLGSPKTLTPRPQLLPFPQTKEMFPLEASGNCERGAFIVWRHYFGAQGPPPLFTMNSTINYVHNGFRPEIKLPEQPPVTITPPHVHSCQMLSMEPLLRTYTIPVYLLSATQILY